MHKLCEEQAVLSSCRWLNITLTELQLSSAQMDDNSDKSTTSFIYEVFTVGQV